MQAITLDALLVLDAIDKKGSFAGAAEILYRVPSAITYTVQKLEQDLGVTLFIKEGRRSVLTPAGRLLLEQGREILRLTESLSESVRQLDSGWESSLHITVDSLLGVNHLYPLLEHLLQMQPDIAIHLYEESLAGSYEALLEKRTDIAIGVKPPEKADHIETRLYREFDWVMAVTPGHPLLQKTVAVTVADLEPYRTVVVRDTVRHSPAMSLRLFGKKPALTVPTVLEKIQAQKAGLGIGYLPRALIETELQKGELVALKVEGVSNQSQLYISWWRENKGKARQWFVEKLLASVPSVA